MRVILRILLHTVIVLVATILTQIGGLVWLLSLAIVHFWKRAWPFKRGVVFMVLYLVFTWVVVPLVAPMFGREKVKHASNVRPVTFATVLLNRNYVTPVLNELLQATAKSVHSTGITISYLDANFPFIDGFPLLLHRSHDDGEKIDIAFVYKDEEGRLVNRQKSVSGYGSFSGPRKGEYDQTRRCKDRGYFQYDMTKYITFGSINSELVFSEKHTKQLILALLANRVVGKIFMEPHLKSRLGLKDARVRFHGCPSVRHDDHIHLQLR